MKLYGSLASPFVARCWLAIAAKGGGVPLETWEGGIKSADYLALNPMGKMPLLVDGAAAIPESAVICEYLDARLPGPALLPSDAAGRARVQLLSRLTDIYVLPSTVTLLRTPPEGDAATISGAKAAVDAAFGYLDHFLADGGFAYGSALTIADCAMQSGLTLTLRVLKTHGENEPFAAHGKLATWWRTVHANATLKPAIAEIAEAVAAFQRRRAAEAEAAKKAAAE